LSQRHDVDTEILKQFAFRGSQVRPGPKIGMAGGIESNKAGRREHIPLDVFTV